MSKRSEKNMYYRELNKMNDTASIKVKKLFDGWYAADQLNMALGDNEQCSKLSKGKNTKQKQTKLEEGSGAMKECASSADR